MGIAMALSAEPVSDSDHGVIDAEITHAKIVDAKIVNGKIVDGRIIDGRVVNDNDPGSKVARGRRIGTDNLHKEIIAFGWLGLAILLLLLWK
jgi:hypothetical protein